jgi:fructose-1,6-bisphosphatase I/sedoheptulose-1,7-bisphosphatase
VLTRSLTLTQFLIQERRRFPQASGAFNGLVLGVALACKALSKRVSYGALGGLHGAAGTPGETNVQGEVQQKLDVVANDIFLHCLQWSGDARALLSEELEEICIAAKDSKGDYLLAFDPLDGSSNIDVNVSVGSIFSILRAPADKRAATPADFLQPGTRQVAAGYAIYGPATMFVLTVGRGVHGFTLDPEIGEFLLTHPDMKVPAQTKEFAINASNSRFWEPPIRRYVEECLAGINGARGKDFNMRWIASLVAEAHRILTRGGVFMYPRDTKDPSKPGRLRLLYEANPIGMLVEQAGGRASTGRGPMLQVQPEAIHQRIGLVFGSREEVERIERYHAEGTGPAADDESPLFKATGLFRGSA